ncbi:MAG TPA: aspartyl/asparaginyl beta-hydroxylase domain-containing protein [Steroidobacteraceae bacterium]|nr:aspartyl/asparaginyl beta-hydroxylase domain-containing protein [Steroidobacteraceae bacterium]
MLDLPDQPLLDKHALVGGCVRLPLTVDAQRLRDEVANLPVSLWGTRGGRVGVHKLAEALFLRGHAPAEGDKPVEERAALRLLPYVRVIVEEMIAAPPLRCLLARLPAGAVVAPHMDDRAPYFAKTLRIHVPVETHEQSWMFCAGQTYLMKPGEVWALNNLAVHAVWNAHATLSRTHLICDFLPTPALLELHARGERGLGRDMPEVEQHLWAQADRNRAARDQAIPAG